MSNNLRTSNVQKEKKRYTHSQLLSKVARMQAWQMTASDATVWYGKEGRASPKERWKNKMGYSGTSG